MAPIVTDARGGNVAVGEAYGARTGRRLHGALLGSSSAQAHPSASDRGVGLPVPPPSPMTSVPLGGAVRAMVAAQASQRGSVLGDFAAPAATSDAAPDAAPTAPATTSDAALSPMAASMGRGGSCAAGVDATGVDAASSPMAASVGSGGSRTAGVDAASSPMAGAAANRPAQTAASAAAASSGAATWPPTATSGCGPLGVGSMRAGASVSPRQVSGPEAVLYVGVRVEGGAKELLGRDGVLPEGTVLASVVNTTLKPALNANLNLTLNAAMSPYPRGLAFAILSRRAAETLKP
eukprot:356884-Chlamydomonas_euryale.AAC.2